MPAVTVGIPVYNGACDIATSLDCILAQSHGDLEILVFDNASTDATAQIVRDYAARDHRIRYKRQPFNRGPVSNFGDLVAEASSPYFLWRACDDRSDVNYIEALLALLEANPRKNLAVGRMFEARDGRIERERKLPRLGERPDERLALLFDAPASVFYGLYRRSALAPVMQRIGDRYGEPAWGWDYLALLPFFLDGAMVQTDATGFQFSLRGAPRAAGERRAPTASEVIDARIGARSRFLTIAREFADERYPRGPRRLMAHALIWAYANKRVLKFRRVLRRRLSGGGR